MFTIVFKLLIYFSCWKKTYQLIWMSCKSMKEFSKFLTAKSNSRKSNCVSSLLAANDLYLYMVANICIERQILAYHKNLLYVT